MTAQPPLSGSFSWKGFFGDLKNAALEPLPAEALLRNAEGDLAKAFSGRRAITGETLRRMTVDLLRNRPRKAVMVDEVHHTALVTKERQALVNADTFRSLAEDSGVSLVLARTYETSTAGLK